MHDSDHLFKVTVHHCLVVAAETADEANTIALMRLIKDGVSFSTEEPERVLSEDDLPDNWDGHCFPFRAKVRDLNKEPSRMILEYFEQETNNE